MFDDTGESQLVKMIENEDSKQCFINVLENDSLCIWVNKQLFHKAEKFGWGFPFHSFQCRHGEATRFAQILVTSDPVIKIR
jgi:hypothetical protein